METDLPGLFGNGGIFECMLIWGLNRDKASGIRDVIEMARVPSALRCPIHTKSVLSDNQLCK